MPWKGDPVWIADVLRAEGLTVKEVAGWRDRGHGDFGDIWGVVAHHTGASGNPGPNAIAFHPTLGLCSQLHLSRDGVFTVCGVGVAWHAGNGSWPGLPRDDANDRTIGIEAENNGTEGWSPAQYSAYVRGVAAILRKLGYDSSRVIGHKEWAGPAQGKWDPGNMNMNTFRADVQKAINGKPVAAADVEDELMALSWKNHKGERVTAEVGLAFMDKNIGLILDQLAGPGTRDGANFPGWGFLGDDTVPEAIGKLVAAVPELLSEVKSLRAEVAELKNDKK